jgi:hypothetical protein
VNQALAFGRTGLDRRTGDIAGAVSAAVAIPVIDPSTVLLSLHARCSEASAVLFERAWTEKRSIVWVTAMRATTCIVSRDLAPAMISAYRALAMEKARREIRDRSLDRRAADAAELCVLDVIRSSSEPLTRSAIAARAGLDLRIAEGAVRTLAAAGILLGVGGMGGWRSAMHQIDLTERWLPAAASPDPPASRAAVTAAYLASYGPASLEDLVWWSGFSKGEARAALEACGGVRRGLKFDVARPPKDRAWPAHEVRFLPTGDPLTLAWKGFERLLPRSRARALQLDHRSLAPLIVAGGRAIGTWSLDDGPRLFGDRKPTPAVTTEFERVRHVLRHAGKVLR